MRLFRRKNKKEKNKYGWFISPIQNWQETKKMCDGYDDNRIALSSFKKSLKSDKIDLRQHNPSYPLIAHIAKIAQSKQDLRVVDFGGAFGTTYYFVKHFLQNIELDWAILEQESYCKIFNENSESKDFKLINSIEAISESPDILILSGVMQYIENYSDLIRDLLKLEPKFIIIDRTTYLSNPDLNSIIAIQKVWPEIYGFEVSYPTYFLSKNEIHRIIDDQYNLIDEFSSTVDSSISIGNITADSKGSVWQIRKG